MSVVSVVGSSGRVGTALVLRLSEGFDVRPIRRMVGEHVDELARRAADGAHVVVNAAGVAHGDPSDPEGARRMRLANVDLPVTLAESSLEFGSAFVHISSVKASAPASSEYAATKRAGEDELARRLGPSFSSAGLPLVIVRPLALLFPPLDVGKVRHLRFLANVPKVLVPKIPVPALAPKTFLDAIESITLGSAAGTLPAGQTLREFTADERGSLRDVAAAFRSAR